jgi:hypothetical protein
MFEKQFGTNDELEDVVISKRRLKYENELASVSIVFVYLSFKGWFDIPLLGIP